MDTMKIESLVFDFHGVLEGVARRRGEEERGAEFEGVGVLGCVGTLVGRPASNKKNRLLVSQQVKDVG